MPEQQQLALDAWPPLQRPPRARRTDPDSSHAAIDQLEKRGQVERDMRKARAATERFPGRTSRELARLAGLDRYMLARRLPDLEARSLVRSNRDSKTRKPPPGEPLRWWWRGPSPKGENR